MQEITPELKGAIESLIFISEKPVQVSEIQQVLEGMDTETLRGAILELQKEYDSRHSGIKITEVAGGYQMVTSPYYVNFIKKHHKIRHSEKLSMPALETLAIIAYKQPITKIEIEAIRGVNVDGVLKNLVEKDIIRIAGRKEVIGRPFVYGTTRMFLEYFGLKSLEDLPAIEEFVQALEQKEEENTAEITPIQEEDLQQSETGTITSSAETNTESQSDAHEPEESHNVNQ